MLVGDYVLLFIKIKFLLILYSCCYQLHKLIQLFWIKELKPSFGVLSLLLLFLKYNLTKFS